MSRHLIVFLPYLTFSPSMIACTLIFSIPCVLWHDTNYDGITYAAPAKFFYSTGHSWVSIQHGRYSLIWNCKFSAQFHPPLSAVLMKRFCSKSCTSNLDAITCTYFMLNTELFDALDVTGYSLPLTNRQGGSTSGNIKIVVFFYCNECQRWWRTSTYLSSYCYVWMARPKHQWWNMGVFGPKFGQYTRAKWFGENKTYRCSLRLTQTIIIILHYNVYLIKLTAL